MLHNLFDSLSLLEWKIRRAIRKWWKRKRQERTHADHILWHRRRDAWNLNMFCSCIYITIYMHRNSFVATLSMCLYRRVRIAAWIQKSVAHCDCWWYWIRVSEWDTSEFFFCAMAKNMSDLFVIAIKARARRLSLTQFHDNFDISFCKFVVHLANQNFYWQTFEAFSSTCLTVPKECLKWVTNFLASLAKNATSQKRYFSF